MSYVMETKINICSDCGKEVLLCDACKKQLKKDKEIICIVAGFDRTKHYHNTKKCFPKLQYNEP